ncbi:hypothetical protein LP7551_01972 [Roseibium album]|nr:hypothetical protein LP7551_01972 [Roseibium album]
MDRGDRDLSGTADQASVDRERAQLDPPRPLSEAASDRSGADRAQSNMIVRPANGSEADWQAAHYLAPEAHQNAIFRDIPFAEEKARAIYDRARKDPDRFGLIFAAPNTSEPLKPESLYGFASIHAGVYFLGKGTLIATVQTLNISQKLSGTLLGGKVALRRVKAARHWAKTRNSEHLMVHVTNGVDTQDADEFFRRCGMKTVGGNYNC